MNVILQGRVYHYSKRVAIHNVQKIQSNINVNLGVVTLNLVDIALSSEGDFEQFWKIFDERAELCHKAHKERINHIKDTVADEAPIMWMDGALARLKHGEKIGKLFKGGYATCSLGYAGLYECVKYMTGKSHMDSAEGTEFGMKVMQALNDKCSQWKKEEDIDYSLYGTPMETGTYKFALALKRRFGVIEGITDRDYITNSYHYFVRDKVDPFTKLTNEAKYQSLSPGGLDNQYSRKATLKSVNLAKGCA